MASFTDQIGKTIDLKRRPQRIVSVVPSQTELLHSLGLEKEVVGITKFCVRPKAWHRNKTRVGGTKNLNPQAIRELSPDLILANKEENVKTAIEELASDFPVWTSDVNTLADALAMIRSVGEITETSAVANEIAESILRGFNSLEEPAITYRIAYLIWKDPYMTVGGDTFINDMLDKAGFHNLFANQRRYPVVTVKEMQSLGCELLLLSSEPFPFRENHVKELQQFFPRTKILLVDGEMFSWYGSRLQNAPAYFKELRNSIETMA